MPPGLGRHREFVLRAAAGDLREVIRDMPVADLAEALAPVIDLSGLPQIARGVGVAPGIASGVAVFDNAEAVAVAATGRRVVLFVKQPRPDDYSGLRAATAVVAERGGMTSHAAVVCRSLGYPCVTALADATVDQTQDRLRSHTGQTISVGDDVIVDGTAGRIYRGTLDRTTRSNLPPGVAAAAGRLLAEAQRLGRVPVRVNADSAEDAMRGRKAGAAGVGLCRVEHLSLRRLPVLQQVLTVDRGAAAVEAIAEFRVTLQQEIAELLAAMDGMPVTVRLLDAPWHEFLSEVTSAEANLRREQNPMLGIRGVRAGILRPELLVAQLEALVDACRMIRAGGGDPRPELLVPMVAAPAELEVVRALLRDVTGRHVNGQVTAAGKIPVGVMIETPRAALLAGEFARCADFFSIGTNDLSALVWGLSRDDFEVELLPAYRDLGILPHSPFARLDRDGVATLIQRVVEAARAVRPDLVIGVCGEHAGSAHDAEVLVDTGVSYLSCSAPQVPVALYAAARCAVTAGQY